MGLGFSSLQESTASLMEHGGESSLDQATTHTQLVAQGSVRFSRRDCIALHCTARWSANTECYGESRYFCAIVP